MSTAIPVDSAEIRNSKARIGEFQNGRDGIAPSMTPV